MSTPERGAPEAPKEGRPPRGRRRRRKGPPAPTGPDAAAERVISALHALADALLRRRGLDASAASEVGALSIPVSLHLGGEAEARKGDADALRQALDERLGEAALAQTSFRRGHVYCFRCARSDCEHSRPPSAEHAFARYSPTGQPEWQDFPNLCIDRGDPGADRLFGSEPGVVALLIPGEDLLDRLLPAFVVAERAYRLHGEIAVGLIPLGGEGDKRRGAVTIQVVETRGGRGLPRLRVNVLGEAWDDIAEAAAEASAEEAGEAGARHPAERLRRALMEARRRVETLGRKAAGAERRGEAFDLPGAILPILERLRTEAERIYRRDGRRTEHARERHRQLERPTASAFRDARAAPDERLYFDLRHGTVVVLGPRGRAHLFSLKGRHVTSLFLAPGELERKISRSRWRPLSRERIVEFRATLEAAFAEAERGEGAMRP